MKSLAALCHRLATALVAGVDVRTVWAREAEHARGRAARRHLAAVSRAVSQGQSVAEAFSATGDFFPPLVREMVDVGEQTGHLGEIFARLSEHYQAQVQLRRTFLSAISWPMFELVVALAVIGLLIWVMGFLGQKDGAPIDMLGLGLVGNRGLAIYLAMVGGAGLLLAAAIRAASRGALWIAPVQRAVLYVPALGPALQTTALARLAWSLHLTMNAGMELRRLLRLSLRSTRNARYTDAIERIDAGIARGQSIYETFCDAGCFPHAFLDALHTGEHSGRLVESMALLSRQYQDEARAALATLAMLAGFAVWMVVAGFIIMVIFRLFSFYLGVLNGAMPR
jgi:type IV pilus assembly protein PilC